MWDEDNGVAHWDDMSLAKNYKVRLCRREAILMRTDIGATYTVKENSYDFSSASSQRQAPTILKSGPWIPGTMPVNGRNLPILRLQRKT